MFRSILAGGALAALAAGSSLPSGAQTTPPPPVQPLAVRSVSFDVSGQCKPEQLARLPGLAADRLVKGLGFTYVLKAPNLRTTVNSSSDAITTQPPQFERVIIYGRDPQSKSLIVSFQDQKYCGWADPDVLLYEADKPTNEYRDGPKATKVNEGPDGANNAGNDLDLKVVLQNLKRDGQDGAPILTAPGTATNTPGLRKLKLFFVFEVFKWQEAVDPEKNNEKRIYYLVGRSGEKDRGGHLEGWVHENDLYVWTTRVSAFWAGSGEARGYFDKTLLGGDQFAIKEPDKGKLREPPERTVQRFPVISQEPSTAEIVRLRAGASPEAIDSLIKNYRIATPSCAKSTTSTGPVAEECVTGTSDIDDKVAKLKNIDIMFVMDATTSMELYYPVARKAIEQFIAKLREKQETDVNIRVAVNIYGDYKTFEADTRQVDYVQLMPFFKLDQAQAELVRLDGIKMFDDIHKDKPEAAFAALMKGGSATSWSPQAGIRYLVHIGDHGNREFGKNGGGPGPNWLIEKFKEEDVANELRPKGIIYVAIPVLGKYSEPNNSAFVRQAKRIGELLPKQHAEVKPTYDPGRQQESEGDRVSAILTAMQSGVQISKESRDAAASAIECAQNPQSALCRRSPSEGGNKSGWMAEVIEGLQERAGLSREEINRVYGRSQTVGTFYFKPLASNNQPMFKYYIAIEETPLTRLTNVSIQLCENIDKSDGAKYLKKAIEDTLNTVIDSQSSVADVMASRLFIPAFRFNPLLLKPWGGPEGLEETIRHMQGTAAIEPFKQGFCKSARLLQWAREGKRIADGEGNMVWNASDKVWAAGNSRALRDYAWRHDGGTSIPLYYIPVEFLPN